MTAKTLPIRSALISVFDKQGLAPVVLLLKELGVKIYSTGGTESFIRSLGADVFAVEGLTDYPSIFGGRVKTLHPKIFGGILHRRSLESDREEAQKYDIPSIDLVIVDLYPFEKTVASGASQEDIIEKIDIGGVSLIRAAAKNFAEVLCVSSVDQYRDLLRILNENNGSTTLEERRLFAAKAFAVSSHYDTAIFNYFNQKEQLSAMRLSFSQAKELRYGENPHQRGSFFGDFEDIFEKISGKELSYNNLLDVDAAYSLISEFTDQDPTFAILKHNNACGLATRATLVRAYQAALAADPVSAFGGVLIANTEIDEATAREIHSLFCEVIIAPSFSAEALEILTQKKNRILLKINKMKVASRSIRNCLNGVLVQDSDNHTDSRSDLQFVTEIRPTEKQVKDLLFASKICKHTKSNAIVLVKDEQLLASGTGQTSRVDALKQAIEKAQNFGFSLSEAVMASDAFFPFPDCVEIAHKAGVTAVIQPGGSIKDQLSVDFCNKNKIAMLFTGIRHFKH